MADEKRIESFEEFWPYYVGEHKKKATRIMHFVGTTAAVSCFATGLLTRHKWLMAVAPVCGYGPAWISHFFIEKNKPATFKYPAWSLQADFVMWWKMVKGEMQAEVDRVVREQAEQEERSRQEDEKSTREPVATAVPSEAVN